MKQLEFEGMYGIIEFRDGTQITDMKSLLTVDRFK